MIVEKYKFQKLLNIGKLSISTTLSQIITIIAAPISIKIFGIENYGTLNTYTAIVSIFTVFSCLGYQSAIIIPKKDCTAKLITMCSFFYLSIMATITLVVILSIEKKYLTSITGIDNYFIIYTIPIGVLVSSIYSVIQQWHLRNKAYWDIGKETLIQSLISNTSKILAGQIYPNETTLIISNLIAQIFIIIKYVMKINLNLSRFTFYYFKYFSIKIHATSIEYKDFPLLRNTQNIINVISHNLPTVMLTKFAGTSITGYYGAALSILGAPLFIIGNSISTVYTGEIAECLKYNKPIRKSIHKGTILLFSSGVAIFSVIYIFSEILFVKIFGHDFVISSDITKIIMPWLFFQYITRPIFSGLICLRCNKILMIYEVFSTSAKIASLIVGLILLRDYKFGLQIFSTVGSVSYIVLILISLRIFKNHDLEIAKNTSK